MTRKVRESELDAMRQRAERAERERDQLRQDWSAEHNHCLAMKRSANQLAKTNERLRIELAERNEECEELRAHCERLRSALQRMVDEAAHLAGFSENTEKVVVEALREAPDQLLCEIRAEAGREGFVEGWRASRSIAFGSDLQDRWNIPEEKADEYAQQIREGKE